jgi:hypothetical protein
VLERRHSFGRRRENPRRGGGLARGDQPPRKQHSEGPWWGRSGEPDGSPWEDDPQGSLRGEAAPGGDETQGSIEPFRGLTPAGLATDFRRDQDPKPGFGQRHAGRVATDKGAAISGRGKLRRATNPKSATGMKQARAVSGGVNRQEGEKPCRRNQAGEANPRPWTPDPASAERELTSWEPVGSGDGVGSPPRPYSGRKRKLRRECNRIQSRTGSSESEEIPKPVPSGAAGSAR